MKGDLMKAYLFAVIVVSIATYLTNSLDLLSVLVTAGVWTAIAWRVGYMRKVREGRNVFPHL